MTRAIFYSEEACSSRMEITVVFGIISKTIYQLLPASEDNTTSSKKEGVTFI